MSNICNNNEADWYFILDEVVPVLPHYDQIFVIANQAYWVPDIDLEMRMFSSSRFVCLVCHNVEALALPPRWGGDLYVSCPAVWPLLCVFSPPIFVYFSSVMLVNKVGRSRLCNLATTEMCTIAILHFLVIRLDGAVGDQFAYCHLCNLFHGILVPLLTRFQTRIHSYRLGHLMDGSLFENASAYVAFPHSNNVDRTPCDTDLLWFYYWHDWCLSKMYPKGW